MEQDGGWPYFGNMCTGPSLERRGIDRSVLLAAHNKTADPPPPWTQIYRVFHGPGPDD